MNTKKKINKKKRHLGGKGRDNEHKIYTKNKKIFL